jgi:hypothetical protein
MSGITMGSEGDGGGGGETVSCQAKQVLKPRET